MTYENFVEKLKQELEVQLGETFQIKRDVVQKNNGISKDVFLLRKEGGCIAPILYLDIEYQKFLKGCSMEVLTGQIKRKLEKGCGDLEEKWRRMALNFSEAKDKICFHLVNFERNWKFLEESAWFPILDMAALFTISVEREDGTMENAVLPKGILKIWGINLMNLYDIALKNMQQQFPAQLKTLEEITGTELKGQLVCPVHILSNQKMCYGASCILYPGVLNLLAKKYQTDIFILPSSVHETLLIPDMGMQVRELEEMVQFVNENEVPMEFVLSDKVYRYNRLTGKIEYACTERKEVV